MAAELNNLSQAFLQGMTVAQYFQSKLDTKNKLEEIDNPDFYKSINNLVDAISHTENMEEKTGLMNEEKLNELLTDHSRLEQMLSHKFFRKEKILDLINQMILSQKLQQEYIRQEMERLHDDLLQCKNLIEDLTQGKDPSAPAMGSNLICSKLYQIIGNVNTTRRDLALNIEKVRKALPSHSEKVWKDCEVFAQKTVKEAKSFFTRIKETVSAMKNRLFSVMDSVRESAETMQKQIGNAVSEILDDSSSALMELRDYINGNSPEMLDVRLHNQQRLVTEMKRMVESGKSEKSIQKFIKSFCTDNNLSQEIPYQEKYLHKLMKQQGFAHA